MTPKHLGVTNESRIPARKPGKTRISEERSGICSTERERRLLPHQSRNSFNKGERTGEKTAGCDAPPAAVRPVCAGGWRLVELRPAATATLQNLPNPIREDEEEEEEEAAKRTKQNGIELMKSETAGRNIPTETAGEGRSQDRIQVLECLERTRNSDDGPLLPPPNLDPTAENDVASPRRVVSLREGLAERAPAEWEGKTGYAFPRVRRRGEKRSKRGSGTVIKTGTGW